jgi:hypothetical protein
MALLAGTACALEDNAPLLGTGAGALRSLLAATALVSAVGALVAARPGADPGRWARGAAGEISTAALLEKLPRRRWAVLHDLRLPASRANIDHLVIGPTGVWVVDSKAYRAALQARWHKVLAGGVAVDTSPVRWESEVVSRLLEVRSRPLVAVHGHGLPARGRRCGGVRVLPAAKVVRRLKRGALWRRRLSPSAVRALAERATAALPSYTLVARARPGAARDG